MTDLSVKYGTEKTQFEKTHGRSPTPAERLFLIQTKLGLSPDLAASTYCALEGVSKAPDITVATFGTTGVVGTDGAIALGGYHTVLDQGVYKSPLEQQTEQYGIHLNGYGFTPTTGVIPASTLVSPNGITHTVQPVPPVPHHLAAPFSFTVPIQTRLLTHLDMVKSLVDELPETQSLQEVRLYIQQVEQWIIQNVPSNTVYAAVDHAKIEQIDRSMNKDGG